MWEVTNGKKWSDPQNFRHSMVIPSSSLCEMRSWRYILWHFGGWGLWSQKGRCHSPLSSASAKQRVWTIGSSLHMCAYLGFGTLINPCIISLKHKIHLLIIRIMTPSKHENNKYYIGYIFWWWWSMFSVATRGWLEGTHVDLIGAWQSHQWKIFQVWSTVFLWYHHNMFLIIGLWGGVHEVSAPQQPHVAAPRCPPEGVKNMFYPNCSDITGLHFLD